MADTTDICTATVPSTAGVGDSVASGITGGSPGHYDTSETMLDCCNSSWRYWNWRIYSTEMTCKINA